MFAKSPLKDRISKDNFTLDNLNFSVVPASIRLQNTLFNQSKLEIKAWKLIEFDSEKLMGNFEVNFT